HPDEAAEWEQVRAYFAKAWPTVLEMCRKHLEKDAKSDETRQVCEGVVEAPVAAVWDALTTKKGMESWQVAHAEVDLKVGGMFRTHYSAAGVIGDPNTIENQVIAFDPNRFYSIRIARPPEKF